MHKSSKKSYNQVELNWPDGHLNICFTYAAIDSVEAEFGAQWSERLGDLFVGKSKKDLEFVASVTTGLAKDEIAKLSPPIVPLVNALYHAWQLAWHGDIQAPSETEDPDQAEKKFLDLVRFWTRPSNSGLD